MREGALEFLRDIGKQSCPSAPLICIGRRTRPLPLRPRLLPRSGGSSRQAASAALYCEAAPGRRHTAGAQRPHHSTPDSPSRAFCIRAGDKKDYACDRRTRPFTHARAGEPHARADPACICTRVGAQSQARRSTRGERWVKVLPYMAGEESSDLHIHDRALFLAAELYSCISCHEQAGARRGARLHKMGKKKMLSFLSFLSVLVWCAGERPGGGSFRGARCSLPPIAVRRKLPEYDHGVIDFPNNVISSSLPSALAAISSAPAPDTGGRDERTALSFLIRI